jgi:hypothetical protein
MEFEGGEDVKVAVVDDLVILFCPLVFLLKTVKLFLSLEVKVVLFHKFGVVLQVKVGEVILRHEVVVDLVQQIAEDFLVEGVQVVEVLERDPAAELGLAVLSLIVQS